MKIQNQFRHGDLLIEIEPVKAVPETAKPRAGVVLEVGEGVHEHRVSTQDHYTPETTMPDCDIFVDQDGTVYFEAKSPVHIVHEEHGPIPVEPGIYRVTRQVEYDPYQDQIRKVQD